MKQARDLFALIKAASVLATLVSSFNGTCLSGGLVHYGIKSVRYNSLLNPTGAVLYYIFRAYHAISERLFGVSR